MDTSDDPNWGFDYPLIDDIAVAGGDLVTPAGGFYWNTQGNVNSSCDASVGLDKLKYDSYCYLESVENISPVDCGNFNESNPQKRGRLESSSASGSKACREKMRRDKLNDRFVELGSILEPAKELKLDKVAILTDAARMVAQLRNETQMLKESNEDLHDKIKELKSEKNELRDEKQRLKAEKESLEQQIKLLNARPSFMPHPPLVPAAYAAHGEASGHKTMVPIMGYPGYPMWQFMPPADVDTSQDAESFPPVA